MQLLTSLLLTLFLIPSSLVEVSGDGVQTIKEKIHWTEGRKLTWLDFRGTPSGPNDYVASTNSGVSFSFSYQERNGVGKVDFTVLSNFYPNLSWYRPERVSKYILKHEQMHFDISELHARKLRKHLASLIQDRTFKTKAEPFYEANERERRKMQKQFDTDSDHSNKKEEEFRWRTYIAAQLKVYERWK